MLRRRAAQSGETRRRTRGWLRGGLPAYCLMPFASAAWYISVACLALRASGFSARMCLPASIAAMQISKCESFGVATTLRAAQPRASERHGAGPGTQRRSTHTAVTSGSEISSL